MRVWRWQRTESLHSNPSGFLSWHISPDRREAAPMEDTGMSKNERVLGIDLGYRATGFALLERTDNPSRPVACVDAFCISMKSPTKKPKNMYMNEFYLNECVAFSDLFQKILLRTTFKNVSIELPTGSTQSGRAATQMALVSGVLASILREIGLYTEGNYKIVRPGDVKQALTGDGKASKRKCMTAAITWVEGLYEEQGTKCLWRPIADDPRQFNSGTFEHIADAIGAALCVL